ncbi:MAG TPA: glycosyltransferase [Edaphocola sp.]|nr:glycosyltransferase [Edaphocola sp.]
MNNIQVSIIIVSYNVQPFLDLCLDSVFRALKPVSGEVFVVDNNSTDGSPEMVANRYPEAKLIRNHFNAGFAKANNQAVAQAKGTFIHFLNPDTVLPEDFYEKTLAFMQSHPEAGALGPQLLDGKGGYAPDSKKAFPSFWTSVYKVTGLSKIFSKSKKFNRYYRRDLSENETAPVEILSGCCLMVREAAMKKAGGSFDEGYFMFCEDVDLCHRIGLAGYKNIYFPEVAIIHYKGESTRKLSLQYMKIFYSAHVRFVRKYYPKKTGAFYINALGIILGLRNFFYVGRHFFSLFKLFFFDALLLTVTTIFIKRFWFHNIAHIEAQPFSAFIPSLLFFLFCWLGLMFLNGAYDKPFSLFKAGRGMLLGTLFVLAGYALFPLDYRFSRAVVLISGLVGFALVLFIRWIFGALGWIRLVPRGKLDYKAVLVSDENHYAQTISVIKNRSYYATIIGRIAPEPEAPGKIAPDLLGTGKDLLSLQQQFKIDEIIFNAASTSYKQIIKNMQLCSTVSFFKIQASKSLFLVGSHNNKNTAEIYFVNQRYAIDAPSAKRNKRIMDLLLAISFTVLFPFLRFKVNDPHGFRENIRSVFSGKKTWVGYSNTDLKAGLPRLREGVLPPYKILADYQPGVGNQVRLAKFYAKDFSVWDDLPIILSNFKHLGRS